MNLAAFDQKLTWRQEEPTSCFVQAVAGEWSSTDDEEPAEQHSYNTNDHKDAPDASVNWKWATSPSDIMTMGSLKWIKSMWTQQTLCKQKETLTYGGVILCGIVGLLGHWEWEEVGVHAHLEVGLIGWRETE